MNKNGPVIIIEDDEDDQEILKDIFGKLNYPNETIYFSDGHSALEYFTNFTTLPFLILSDINMPKLNGLQLRAKMKLDKYLSQKCIPYLFFTTALDRSAVIEAYSLSAQGFFVKENTMQELTNTITLIMEYWKKCAAPNNF